MLKNKINDYEIVQKKFLLIKMFFSDIQEYFRHIVPLVTQQCPPKNLIPSLLFRDCQFPDTFSLEDEIEEHEHTIQQLQNNGIFQKVLELNASVINKDIGLVENPQMQKKNDLEKLSTELNVISQTYLALKEETKAVELDLIQVC